MLKAFHKWATLAQGHEPRDYIKTDKLFFDNALVQDVLSVSGYLEFGGAKGDKLVKVALQKSHPYAAELVTCLNSLFRNLKG